MSKQKPLPTYSSFLLRLWREGNVTDEQEAGWRFTLQHVSDGSQRHFTDVQSLMAYLNRKIEAANSEGE